MTLSKLVLVLWLASSVFAQSPPKFEVATAKLAAPDAAVRSRVMPSSPDRLSIPGTIVQDHTGLKGRSAMHLDFEFAPPRPAQLGQT